MNPERSNSLPFVTGVRVNLKRASCPRQLHNGTVCIVYDFCYCSLICFDRRSRRCACVSETFLPVYILIAVVAQLVYERPAYEVAGEEVMCICVGLVH